MREPSLIQVQSRYCRWCVKPSPSPLTQCDAVLHQVVKVSCRALLKAVFKGDAKQLSVVVHACSIRYYCITALLILFLVLAVRTKYWGAKGRGNLGSDRLYAISLHNMNTQTHTQITVCSNTRWQQEVLANMMVS